MNTSLCQRLLYRVLKFIFTITISLPFLLFAYAGLGVSIVKTLAGLLLEQAGLISPIVPIYVRNKQGIQNTPENAIPRHLKLRDLLYRIPPYLKTTALTFPKAYAHHLSGLSSVKLISDELLDSAFAECIFAHGLRVREDKFYLELGDMRSIQIFQGTKWPINGIILNSSLQVEAIALQPNILVTKNDIRWDMCKMYAVSQMFAAGTVMFHSWTHFTLPDLAAIALDTCVDHNSTLYALLFPHLDFTITTNQVKNDSISISNTKAKYKRLIPWLAFPLTAEELLHTNQNYTNMFYNNTRPIRIPSDTTDRDFFAATGFLKEENEALDRWDPLTLPRETRTPYHVFLKMYYDLVLAFVEDIYELLEKEEVSKWLAEITNTLPEMNINHQDALALVIWQCSFLHSCDHDGLGKFREYICGSLNDKMDTHNLATNYSSWDVCRARSFATLFGMVPSFNKRMFIAEAQHGNPDTPLRSASNKFRKSLKDHEAKLIAKGKNLVPLNNVTASICF